MVPEHEFPDLHWKSVGERSGHVPLPTRADAQGNERFRDGRTARSKKSLSLAQA